MTCSFTIGNRSCKCSRIRLLILLIRIPCMLMLPTYAQETQKTMATCIKSRVENACKGRPTHHSVTRSPRLGDDSGHFVDLSLRAAKRTELFRRQHSISRPRSRADGGRTLFLANFLALLSLEFRRSSMQRRSYGARPQTSLTISRQNCVRLLRWPFMRETLGFVTRGVTLWPRLRPTATTRARLAKRTSRSGEP